MEDQYSLFNHQIIALDGDPDSNALGKGLGLKPAFDTARRKYRDGQYLITLSAVPGSGKTPIIAEMMIHIRRHHPDCVMLLFSVGKIPQQDLAVAKHTFQARQESISCLKMLGEVNRPTDVRAGDVIFGSFDQIARKGDNIVWREGPDGEVWMSEMLRNIRAQGLSVVLFVDESHTHYSKPSAIKTMGVVENDIRPDVEIRATATPVTNDVRSMVLRKAGRVTDITIPIESVRESGLIVRNILCNNETMGGVGHIIRDEFSRNDLLDASLHCRSTLHGMWERVDGSVTPMMMIICPSRSNGELEHGRYNSWVRMLLEVGITVANGKLVEYISERKSVPDPLNLPPEAEVIIVKQGLLVGWDMPRLSVILLDRDIKDNRTAMQALSRMGRTVRGRYEEDEHLNHSYLYTNIDSPTIRETIKQLNETTGLDYDYDHVVTRIRKGVPPVKLPGRIGRSTRTLAVPGDTFAPLWDDLVTQTLNLPAKLARQTRIIRALPTEYNTLGFQTNIQADLLTGTVDALDGSRDIRYVLDEDAEAHLVRNLIAGVVREQGISPGGLRGTVETIVDCIHFWFHQRGLPVPIANRILIASNETFRQVITDAIRTVKRDASFRSRIIHDVDFVLPEMIHISLTTKQDQEPGYRKSMHLDQPSSHYKGETDFERLLETLSRVLYWHYNDHSIKSGDGGIDTFSIGYMCPGDELGSMEQNCFPPDYLAVTASGWIWILEVKAGDGSRYEYLAEYKLRGMADSVRDWACGYHATSPLNGIPSVHEGRRIEGIGVGIVTPNRGEWYIHQGDTDYREIGNNPGQNGWRRVVDVLV